MSIFSKYSLKNSSEQSLHELIVYLESWEINYVSDCWNFHESFSNKNLRQKKNGQPSRRRWRSKKSFLIRTRENRELPSSEHSVKIKEFYSYKNEISWNQHTMQCSTALISRKFCEKKVKANFFNFHTVHVSIKLARKFATKVQLIYR